MDYRELSIKELFGVVYNDDGSVKPCGREACKALILRFEELFGGGDFGNAETGQMNIQKMHDAIRDV